MNERGRKHLVCSLGTTPYREIVYRLGDATWTTRFAPVAVARLHGVSTGVATVLVTDDARTAWYTDLAVELEEAGLSTRPVSVPDGRGADLMTIVELLIDAVDEGDDVILDVSLAVRHLPFIYMAALTYLSAHKRVTIRGVYNGALVLGSGTDEAPIIDLSELFGLTRWYAALRAGMDSGDLRRIADLISEEQRRAGQQAAAIATFRGVTGTARRLSDALASGLPLETGVAAHELIDALRDIEAQTVAPPARRLALERLAGWVTPLATDAVPLDKKAHPLNHAELHRQLEMARWYADRGNGPNALLLLREWLVSLVILLRNHETGWLSKSQRWPAEQWLHAAEFRHRNQLATDGEAQFGRIWSQIGQRRNHYAHAGMTEQQVPAAATVGGLIDACAGMLAGNLSIAPAPTAGTMLISALGLSPGLLYSAVRAISPDSLVVVTSADALPKLEIALERAGASGLRPTTLVMEDPHAGFRESEKLCKETLPLLATAAQVKINLTGGTTVMQHVVERLGRQAERLGVPVERVALVDRRPFDEQRANPYVPGDLLSLKDAEGGA